MKIVITANGPGEVAGWVRPLLRRLYERAPETEVHLFLVPDDYATGREAQMARDLFPNTHVYDPKTYVAVALGRRIEGLPKRADVVQYMGGDLMHAARLHGRFGGLFTTYKFSRARYRERIMRAFAVDEKNVEQLRAWKTPPERIVTTGNLAIDGALIEAQLPPEPHAPHDGLLMMPGSRDYEVDNVIPLFFTAALRIARESPELPIAFGLSPFTSLEQVRDAVARGGDPRMWAQRARLVERGSEPWIESLDGHVRVPILRNALAAAATARLVLTIPGTKCIELAALGKPMVAITPLNAPELVTFNGPLTYLNRIPLVGVALKRAVAVGVSRRFPFHTQPNIDTGEMLVQELHGTLTAGRIARIVLDAYHDRDGLATRASRLGELYRTHVGASDRMAESLLNLAGT